MKRDHDGDFRGFIIENDAPYPLITFGLYNNHGGTSGEMGIRWHDLFRSGSCARLEAFEDSWSALSSFSDVIQKLGKVDSDKITPDEFKSILLSCGFVEIID